MSRVLPVNMAPRAFSTVGLPASRQVELWETHNATALIGLDVQASEPLVATEPTCVFPGSISPGWTDPPTWSSAQGSHRPQPCLRDRGVPDPAGGCVVGVP